MDCNCAVCGAAGHWKSYCVVSDGETCAKTRSQTGRLLLGWHLLGQAPGCCCGQVSRMAFAGGDSHHPTWNTELDHCFSFDMRELKVEVGLPLVSCSG